MRAASLILVSTLWTAVTAQSVERTWPEIAAVSAQFKVDFSAERIVIDLPIRDRTGRERYHFACRGGRESYLDSLRGNWVGPLMCTLAEGSEAREESLLAEDDSPAWFSRGQFQRAELTGACAKYPEFGRHRSFRLRRLRVNLDSEDVAVDATGLVSAFVLKVSVSPDATSLSERAERPGFLDPRRQNRGCTTVRLGTDSGMCRDWQQDGKWMPCKP